MPDILVAILVGLGAAGAVIILCWLGGIVLDHIDEGTD
jgi:hypothetical protein